MARRPRPPRPLFPRGAGVGFRAFVLAIAAIAIWFSDQRGFEPLQVVRASIAVVVRPLLAISASPLSLSAATQQFRSQQLLAAENRSLREAAVQLSARQLKYEALEAENVRLRQLTTSAATLKDKVLFTEIIAVNQDPYRHQITLNKGQNDGVYQGQALVDSFGIMGQVVHVDPSTATALLITDPGHGIPIEINRTGLQTIARGSGDGRALILPFLPGNADVQIGDLLVTSGLGGRFPAGYPVGTVYDVKRGTGAHFMQASATASARLYQSRQALLVWGQETPLIRDEALNPDPNLTPPTADTSPLKPAEAAIPLLPRPKPSQADIAESLPLEAGAIATPGGSIAPSPPRRRERVKRQENPALADAPAAPVESNP